MRHCCPAEFLLVAEKRKVPPGCGMACRQLHGQVVPSYRRPPTLKCLRLCEYSHTDTHRSTYLPTYLPACLPACLPTYLPTYLTLPNYQSIYLHTYKFKDTSVYVCIFVLRASYNLHQTTELSGSFLHEGCQAAARAAGRAPSTCEVLLAL